jgi:hypothetical protein
MVALKTKNKRKVPVMTKYYSVMVEIVVKASDEADAFDMVEGYVDDMVCNSKELQDYALSTPTDCTPID